MGFIEETGAAALYRDARIAPIYEGTNGIQAIDLVTRKLPQSGGEHVHGYIAELARGRRGAAASRTCDGFGRTAVELEAALDDLRRRPGISRSDCCRAAERTRRWPAPRPISGCSRWPPAAPIWRAARSRTAREQRIALCRFFAENLAGETGALRDRVIEGADSLAAAGKGLISA